MRDGLVLRQARVALRHGRERRRVGATDDLPFLLVLKDDHDYVREGGHTLACTRAGTPGEHSREDEQRKTVHHALSSTTRRRQTCKTAMSSTTAIAPTIAA